MLWIHFVSQIYKLIYCFAMKFITYLAKWLAKYSLSQKMFIQVSLNYP